MMSNYENSRNGRIWVVWSPKTRVTRCFKSDQLITCSVFLEGSQEEIFFSFVYVSNHMNERKVLWEDLENHKDSPLFRSKPWLVMGDFNETLDVEEHSDFVHSPTVSVGMRDSTT